MATRIDSLLDVTGQYDVILCDVWGVLHNGVDAFPAAGAILSKAREAGTTVVLITNSPRPRDGVEAQLGIIGVPETAFDRIVTSGDVTRKLILEGPKKVFLLGPERDVPLLDGLGVELASEEEAEVIVCTGLFDDESETAEDYREMLTRFVARGVPLICANPDLIVERGEKLVPCAGAVAAVHAELGGETRIAGKPHAPIYAAAMAEAEAVRGPLDKARVLAIGDGMPTDVKGAQDAGLDLLYISGGIHAAEYTAGGKIDEDALAFFLKRENATPKWWMQKLA